MAKLQIQSLIRARCVLGAVSVNPGSSLHISRRIRFSGEMWLNRLDDRPQGNSQTIAPDYYLKRDRSSCDGRFFLKANRCKLSPRGNGQKFRYQVDSLRKRVTYATVFVKYAGLGLIT
jgi:hypothetical protein